MIAPSQQIVAMADAEVNSLDFNRKHQLILADQAQEVRAAVPNQSPDFYSGYELGVHTARVLLQHLPAATEHNVSL